VVVTEVRPGHVHEHWQTYSNTAYWTGLDGCLLSDTNPSGTQL